MSEESTVSQAQKNAVSKYRREKVKEISLRFYPSHYELWEHVKSQPKAAEYVRNLIREDMVRSKRQSE